MNMKMDVAHFNPKELKILDESLGGPFIVPHTTTRHYGPLETLLEQNPHVERLFMKEYERHAKGGQIGEILMNAERLRKMGRNGDSEIAYIGPRTKELFNRMMHGGSTNPGTKKPEYFGLGNLIGGIGNTLKGIGKGAINTVGNIGKGVVNGVKGLAGHAVHGAKSAVTGIANNLPGMVIGGLMGGPPGALAGATAQSTLSNMGGGGHGGGGGGFTMPQMPTSLSDLGNQFMNSSLGKQALGIGQNAMQQGTQLYNNTMKQGNQLYNDTMQQGQGLYNNAMQQGQDLYNQGNQAYQGAMAQANDMMQPSQGPSMMDQFVQNNPYARAAQSAYQAYNQPQTGYGY